MTRAADRLIVCGADGMRRGRKAAGTIWCARRCDPVARRGRRERRQGSALPQAAQRHCRGTAADGISYGRNRTPRLCPHGCGSRRPPRRRARRRSRHRPPSTKRSAALTPAGSAADRQKALTARAACASAACSRLPDIPPPHRAEAAERYLANAAADFSPAERAEIAQQVLAILNDLNFADVFAPGSRAEVPIVGRIAARGRRPDLGLRTGRQPA